MLDPTYLDRSAFEAARKGLPFEARLEGLWCCGDLAGLGRPCVAIVGTRAATGYGRAVAARLAADLGRAGCCVVSGLALGIDAAAHEGALEAGAPTIGILGGGHRCFFPQRNRPLAQRIVVSGGAVLSPYAPDRRSAPHQFLERNGIIAALADAVVVVEAPARSGALNTAGWAAGRIPVLAVPGDVDRKHVAGCLALIRDGATLARGADDVLEALGRLPLSSSIPAEPPPDGVAAVVLATLDAGARTLDEIVAAATLEASSVLAALSLLELEGRIESRGGVQYARVAAASRGEDARE
ncbi:MAG: DNA-protecting protein DprA [Candidatus Eremiobacteraeota bacterium]|nr:DNA-protecting protein DprA [Candidatus Eremiobacteraeota bacterium]MBV9056976.1 DNA-protecting protein DprA [Candidatus Eremiobacteraeota bacterium]MBV9698765.1 DNA-protecting protein DprA [Candidatus Eremiobacteraeota bacterium]